MSELKINKNSFSLLNMARFIGTFSNRFFAAFCAMALGYGLIKRFMPFKSSPLSLPSFYIVCFFVTGLWTYYLLQLTPPLLNRPISKFQKSKLIRSRIFVIFILFFIKNGLEPQLSKGGLYVFGPISFILSIAILSSFITLIALIFKKAVSRKIYKNSAGRKRR